MDKKEVVLMVEVCRDKIKKKVMQTVSRYKCVESLKMDMKNKKLVVTGDVDPVCLTRKLRKYCCTYIDTVSLVKKPQENPKPPDNPPKPPSSGDNKPKPPKPHPVCNCPQCYYPCPAGCKCLLCYYPCPADCMCPKCYHPCPPDCKCPKCYCYPPPTPIMVYPDEHPSACCTIS